LRLALVDAGCDANPTDVSTFVVAFFSDLFLFVTSFSGRARLSRQRISFRESNWPSIKNTRSKRHSLNDVTDRKSALVIVKPERSDRLAA
jgi:hypothetical protein